jgi:apolipoprotein N-acyltransferase
MPVIRAANAGVSSSTGRDGAMRASTGLFEVVTLGVDVAPTTTAPTFYARTGQWVIWCVAGFLGLVMARSIVRRRPR